MSTPAPFSLPTGSRAVPLGSGLVTALVGEGGVARVYEVHNKRLGVYRAVKVLKPDASPDARARFEREMRIMPHLHHPHIATVYATGRWHGLPYIEMERVRGVSLDALLAQRGPLPVEVALAIGMGICRALVYVHTHEFTIDGRAMHGILHRDLKPANTLVTPRGGVKLTDFGAARTLGLPHTAREQMFVGSLQYVAPEELKGDSVRVESDIYSLGCLLYEMLTGQRTFPQTRPAELVRARLRNTFEPLGHATRRLPRELHELVTQCLSVEIDRRPQSVAIIHERLSRLRKRHTALPAEQTIRAFMSGSPRRGFWNSMQGLWLPQVSRLLRRRPRTAVHVGEAHETEPVHGS